MNFLTLFSFLKIFKHEDLEEYYVNITHLSELNKTSYPNMFPTFDKAYKDAKKKNSVRRRLVKLCQDEFSSSIIDNVTINIDINTIFIVLF